MAADQITATASTAEARDKNEYVIIVDTIEHVIDHERVTWEEVVEFAYPGQSGDPQYVFKVQYEDAASQPSSGTLVKGGHVEAERDGTTFSVLRSVVS
jgi:Multiubiquitin